MEASPHQTLKIYINLLPHVIEVSMTNLNVDLVSNIYTIQNVSVNSQNIMSIITSFDWYYLKSIKKPLNSVIESANNSKQESETVTNDSN